MSKVARKPINLPEKTQLKIDNNHITIEGPLGSLEFTKNDGIKLIQEDNLLSVQTDKLDLTALSGTTRALLFNMVHGVSIGWKKSLKLVGVGYRAKAQGNILELTVGFSHPVKFPIPEGLKIETPSQTEIEISGVDKQQVGQIAAEIRSVRPPEPYKGKGIRYADEQIIKKEAKKK
mgnify:FL=1|tara:strand:+ start:8583 stop:9110 length:528 start_codon:yes stop_codon:yes gene_type:complete